MTVCGERILCKGSGPDSLIEGEGDFIFLCAFKSLLGMTVLGRIAKLIEPFFLMWPWRISGDLLSSLKSFNGPLPCFLRVFVWKRFCLVGWPGIFIAGFDCSNLLNFWLIFTFEDVGIAFADGSYRVDWLPAPGLLMPLRNP